jgi:hypothetical protein
MDGETNVGLRQWFKDGGTSIFVSGNFRKSVEILMFH